MNREEKLDWLQTKLQINHESIITMTWEEISLVGVGPAINLVFHFDDGSQVDGYYPIEEFDNNNAELNYESVVEWLRNTHSFGAVTIDQNPEITESISSIKRRLFGR